jgi:hypothetical protein
MGYLQWIGERKMINLDYPIELLIRALKEINRQYKINKKRGESAWDSYTVTKDEVLKDMRDKRKQVKKAISVLSKYREEDKNGTNNSRN